MSASKSSLNAHSDGEEGSRKRPVEVFSNEDDSDDESVCEFPPKRTLFSAGHQEGKSHTSPILIDLDPNDLPQSGECFPSTFEWSSSSEEDARKENTTDQAMPEVELDALASHVGSKECEHGSAGCVSDDICCR
jgi:hypothetical protein